jgi:hypothetical protein
MPAWAYGDTSRRRTGGGLQTDQVTWPPWNRSRTKGRAAHPQGRQRVVEFSYARWGIDLG